MAGNGKNRYIVLLNKSPRGPFSVDEINELLRTQVLRRNDIAYLIADKSDSKAPTEWKLIWQFTDFDRRREPQVSGAETGERRKVEPVVEIKEKLIAEVPAELLNIAPEDLLPRNSSHAAMDLILDREEDPDNDPTVIIDRGALEQSSWINPKVLFGSFALLMVAAGGWMLYTTGNVSSSLTTTQAPQPISNQSPGGQPVARTPSASTVRRASSPPPSVTPVQPERRMQEPRYADPEPEPDLGEISEEDEFAEEPNEENPIRKRAKRDMRAMPGMPPGALGDPRDPRDPRLLDPRLAPRRPALQNPDSEEGFDDSAVDDGALGGDGDSDPSEPDEQ